ncbi:ATP-binding protein [Rheinheimera baltica]|uniref:histidine kinase n=1 Tax=Rheinheimera baltica TaxID=67576 RepID=A0ABT9HZF8_9GAMM|nr:ATP-binding protein [Rheinheimera baltica]MDP5136509.1 ATP-binding protein [Rheinheimera baltica]
MLFHSSSQSPHRNLATRVVVIIMVSALLWSILLTAALSYSLYRYELTEAERQFTNIEHSYIPSLEAGLWEADTARINTLLDGIAQLEDVGSVRLTDELNQQFSRQHSTFDKFFASKKYMLQYRIDNEQYSVGQLHIGLIADDIEQRLWRQSRNIALVTVSALLFCAILMLLIFRFAVSRHLHAMAEFASKLDLNRLAQPLKLKRQTRHDELDQVVDAINRLQQRIKHELARRNEVEQQLNNNAMQLEQQVALRTTDLQLKNNTLKQQSSELASQNEELDAYAHTVAHDLKHPLTSVLGMSRLLNATYLELSSEQKHAALTSIDKSANKMNDIINALLLLASTREKTQIPLQPLDMMEIISNSKERLAGVIQQYNVSISSSNDWPKVVGYSMWIEEVWINYLSNAIKYGGRPPHIIISSQTLDNGKVMFLVEDNGQPLNTEQQAALFSPFQRFSPKSADGHGLGLSIVKRIIERLGGNVGYRVSDNGGSIFWFSLPNAD